MSEIDPQFASGGGEDKLKKAMRGLAATSQKTAPAEIGLGLATAFRRHHRRRRIRRMSVAGVVACLIAIVGLFFLRTPHRQHSTTQAHVESLGLPVRTPEVAQTARLPRQKPGIVHKQSTSKAATNTVEYSRQFIALPGYDPEVPAEDLHIVRVQLPTSTLWQMGAPINPAAPERRVLADFVVSQDGTPYGVRLVQTKVQGELP